ncbi:MAG: acylphosphatase [Oscillospiraceae bacterium]|nr:acylphosphatase [Oscillospiraceae bacterium]
MGKIIRKRLCLYGSVQGVGLRWRAVNAARHYGCTGFVKNEDDLSVTMELQGTEEQIDMVLQAVQQGTYIDIRDIITKSIPLAEDERDFHTEY